MVSPRRLGIVIYVSLEAPCGPPRVESGIIVGLGLERAMGAIMCCLQVIKQS